ncbi:hypothetical protein CBLAS_1543 [Campylobacter blaseri]|uniref:Lipoprotein n=1 Tax=Campylobacter blaseri TaxID=2042961 RepID=A0A2P8QZD6_9BACT|nr:hypothetical protein [Campylobacter blaseri]PSM51614.1 hypothetical protein CQ405_07410 [Campylobacter blaseri]PSM53407.1 hypothetical protein CRN67_07415 [Campylobacter blaseri]QKF86704.1 hypothetical protein CBLAS_1543 [Campylobacter blaseri]
MKNFLTILILLVVSLLLGGCASQKNNIIVSIVTECQTDNGVIDWTIVEIPSYGFIPDTMAGPAALKGNDGGFYDSINSLIRQGNKNIAIISRSKQKLKYYTQHMLQAAGNNQYQDVNFCILDVKPDEILLNEQNRTKAKIQWSS